MVQKIWASSCWKRRTRVRPVRAPDSSFLCRTPKSAMRRGNSLQERGRWSNIRLEPNRDSVKNAQITSANFNLTMALQLQYYHERQSIFDLSDIRHFDKHVFASSISISAQSPEGLPMWIAQRLEELKEIKDLNTKSCILALYTAMQHPAEKRNGSFNDWKHGNSISALQVKLNWMTNCSSTEIWSFFTKTESNADNKTPVYIKLFMCGNTLLVTSVFPVANFLW